MAFADEDLQYLPSSLATMRRAFVSLPDADIVTFRFPDRDTGLPAKRYRERPFRHDLRTIAGVSGGRRMYPLAWPAVCMYFALAKHRRYRVRVGLVRWLGQKLPGSPGSLNARALT